MIPHGAINAGIGINMLWSRAAVRGPLLSAARTPQAAQEALLLRILRENQNTRFGQEHSFSSIGSTTEYRNAVPIQTYATLEPYVLAQQEGEAALTARPPVYYARTSGTTGRHKDIPLTARGVRQVKRAQKQLALSLWKDTGFFRGSVLGFASPGEEGRLPSGLPYGATSGVTYSSLSKVVAKKFVIPYEAFSCRDAEAKYEVYALAALTRDDVTGVVAANPSSLLKVCLLIERRGPEFVEALADGKTVGLREETVGYLHMLRTKAQAGRFAILQQLFAEQTTILPETVWPSLSAVATWTGGSCGVALDRLKEHLPSRARIVEYGYGASEFMGSANIDALQNTCVPLLNDHVYEFVQKDAWEAGHGDFLGLHQIKEGSEYYIFVTTRSGLYRYDINDVIRVESGVGSCPGLRFVRKGRGVTSITGEKLSEDQIISAVSSVLANRDLTAPNYLALADEERARYVTYFELDCSSSLAWLADDLDRELRERNAEYDDKRASGRLLPLEVALLRPGAGERMKAAKLEAGVREAQYKPTILDYYRNWQDALSGLAAGIPA
ncbi:MAG: GH3 auxin-responsive promoter family protein [Pseudomonadota bacterium]